VSAVPAGVPDHAGAPSSGPGPLWPAPEALVPPPAEPAIGLVLQGGQIERLLLAGEPIPPEAEVLDFRPHLLAPGTIDVHTHGGAGGSFSTGLDDEAVAICRYRATTGTTALLATITGTWAELTQALPRLARLAAGRPAGGEHGAAILGIHVEGPFLNPARRGAISLATLRSPSVDDLRRLQDAAQGQIKMMTIAPELPRALDVIEEMLRLGIVPSIGHSDATYEQVLDAAGAGARKSTHTYNAMRPLLHRDPGTVGGVLADGRLVAELIADGVHVHAGAMRVLLKAKGALGTVLVTDAVRYAGLPEGVYERPGRGRVTVRNGAALTDDGTIAGSVSPLNRNLRLLRDQLGVPEEALFAMAAAVPAGLLGLAAKGALAPGADADFAVYDAALNCLATFIAGRQVYRAGDGSGSRPIS
jgi:N-acetylglucosamine-6-phosphate deacetylase